MKLIRPLMGAFLCFCVAIPNAFTQVKYGKTTIDELTMTSYPQDTTASAVILSNIGDMRFRYHDESGFQSEYTVEMRIKILKNDGLDFCNQSIDYYVVSRLSKEEITKLEGTTYNLEDGKIIKTKLNKQHIFEEDAENKWKRTKFTMPAAKVGSVIEFKYTVVSNFLYKLPDFKFQYSEPCEYTAYEVVIPEYLRYNVNNQGYENITGKKEPANETFFIKGGAQAGKFTCLAEKISYEGRNIAALRKEPYIWTLNDYVSKVSFELKQTQFPNAMLKNYSTTWENVDREIFESSLLGGNLKKTGLFKEEVVGIDKTFEGASKIQDIVKAKVKWNDKNSLYPGNLKKAYNDGIGNSSDLNFLLINALKAADIDAFPVILSTRGKGRLPFTHPSTAAFNYIITGMRIDTLTYFTDASAKNGGWNNLPEKVMVPQARILTEKRGEWVDLTQASKGAMITSAQFKFDETGLHGDMTTITRGSSSQEFRDNYDAHKDQQEYVEKLATRLNGQIENFTVSGLDKSQGDTEVKYTLTKDASLGDEFLYINPIVDKLFSENPFKSETRKFPVNFDYPQAYIQSVIIQIPKGYEVDELPKSERVTYGENRAISFAYIVGEGGGQISLRIQYQLNELTIVQTEYEALRELYAKIVSKLSEQVVLKKVITE